MVWVKIIEENEILYLFREDIIILFSAFLDNAKFRWMFTDSSEWLCGQRYFPRVTSSLLYKRRIHRAHIIKP